MEKMNTYKLYNNNCLEQLKTFSDNSIDSIVTDPPYGLSFMGKKWDYDVPSTEIWAECLRVLKPGGHLLAFAGTRTQHRMAVRIEDAGFEIRDMIAWVYGSGFPKSLNLKDGWQGWGTALKPALEPITVARKPFKGTVAANVLEWGVGAINVDGCRIKLPEGETVALVQSNPHNRVGAVAATAFVTQGSEEAMKAAQAASVERTNRLGRWPANLIHDGEVAADLLGDAARFFYCAKTSKKDRGDGNNHPTVKPTELMRYLCRLVTPPNGTVLDPFMGSGSTGKAAVLEGFNFIGIELDPKYVEIADTRISEVMAD